MSWSNPGKNWEDAAINYQADWIKGNVEAQLEYRENEKMIEPAYIETLNGYMDEARKTAIWNVEQAKNPIVYCTLGIVGEAGEFADKIKKTIRGDKDITDPLVRMDLLLEAGDVLWYLTNAMFEMGFTLQDVAECNINKLRSRAARGVLKADGDHR